jgi:hypothetical protein
MQSTHEIKPVSFKNLVELQTGIKLNNIQADAYFRHVVRKAKRQVFHKRRDLRNPVEFLTRELISSELSWFIELNHLDVCDECNKVSKKTKMCRVCSGTYCSHRFRCKMEHVHRKKIE